MVKLKWYIIIVLYEELVSMAKPNNDYNLKQNELNSKNNNNLGITSFCNFRKKGFKLI